MCKPLLDDDAWESHKFSIRLVETKRLGRTLPAVVNGLSAAQAQSQGLIEVASDAETTSVANSESLFVGESDDESVSRSRSGSPQDIRPVNAQAPQLNPAATPFNPKPTTTASARPNPFQAATTFGKPSGTPNQTSSTPIFDFNSKYSNQTAPKVFESKEPPKFNFFPSDNGTKAKESKGPGSVFDSKEVPKASFSPSQFGPKTGESSNGTVPSSSTLFMDKKTTFGQPSTTFPTTTTQGQTKAVTEELPTSTEAAVPSKPKSIFDQAKATPTTPPIFSFETSPLFGPVETGPKPHDTKSKLLQVPQEDNLSISALQQKDAPVKFSNSGTPSSPEPKSFSLSAPSNAVTKETNLPQTTPPKYPNHNHPLLPTPESQLNTGSSQPSFLPSSTTPVIQPPLFPPTSKPVETTSTANSILEPIASNLRALSDSPIVKRSGSQSSQAQSTFTSSPLNPKAVALDQLSNCILLEDNGVIQHFIEFTVGPIIKASIAQFNDESSWKEASQSSPSGFLCGERMLIGNRGVSCSLVS